MEEEVILRREECVAAVEDVVLASVDEVLLEIAQVLVRACAQPQYCSEREAKIARTHLLGSNRRISAR